jgi:toxin ParE1/3/4
MPALRLQVHPAAEREMREAVQWLRQNFGPHAASRLATSIDAAGRLVLQQPEIGAPTVASARQLALSGYPFSLVYRVQGDALQVLALRHQRRLPHYWTHRAGAASA